MDLQATGSRLSDLAGGRRLGMALAFCFLMLLSVCGCAPGRYVRIVDGLESSGLMAPGTESVPMQVVAKRDATPIANTTVRIVSRRGEITLETNSRGVVHLPVTDELRRANPQIEVDTEIPLNFRHMASGYRKESPGKVYTFVATEGKEKLEDGPITVWYEEGLGSEGLALLEELRAERDLIERVTGLEPIPWGIILVAQRKPNEWFLRDSTGEGMMLWVHTAENVSEVRFVAFNTHEWTEATVDDRLQLYDTDDANRFIGDGIADYMYFLRTGWIYRHDRPLERLLEGGTTHVNLPRRFRVSRFDNIAERDIGFYEGYALSFVFWHNLCREYGEDLPRRFCAAMADAKKRDAKTAIRILENLTGSRDIRRRLVKADVAAAIETLKSLPEPPH